MKRMIIGISGASGAVYGIRLLEVLRGVDEVETHLVLSPAARRTIELETDRSVERVEALAGTFSVTSTTTGTRIDASLPLTIPITPALSEVSV